MKSLLWRRIFGFSGTAVVVALVATNVFAASSTNYAIPGDTTSSVGGGTSSSTNYTIPKASGDVGGGTSSSTNYNIGAGVIFIESDPVVVPPVVVEPPGGGGTPTVVIPPVVVPPPGGVPVVIPPVVTPPGEIPPGPPPVVDGGSVTPPVPVYVPPEVVTPPLVPEPAGGISVPPSSSGGGSSGSSGAPPDSSAPVSDRITARDVVFALQFETMRAVTEETVQGVKLNIYPGHPVSVSIPDERIKRPVDRILLQVGEQYFQFVHDKEAYTLQFPSPPNVGVYPMSIAAMYKDSSTDLINFLVEVRPPSLIFSHGSIIPEPGVTVTLHEKIAGDWRIFDATPYKQSNPQRTDAAGHYAFVVPPGTYHVTVVKDGYFDARTNEFTTGSNIIESNVEIVKKPKTLVAGVKSIPRIFKYRTGRVVGNPVIERATENVVTPAVAATVIASAAAAVPAVSMLTYLQYLITQPLFLLRRRKRHGWGTIFNSLTKLPVDLAIVRLLDAQTNRVLATRVTDRQGRYSFIAPEGRFKLQVQKQGFVYPTRYLKGKTEDLGFVDLYEGEVINATKGAMVAVNIAVDPVEKMVIPSEVVWRYRKQKIQLVISLSGIAFAAVACVITPKIITFGILGGHIVLFGLFRRLAYPKRPKSWGVVYDAGNKEPVGQAIVRIFETKFNKLLESWPTDARGRYSFLVGNNLYYVTVEKPGYSKYQSDQIDLRNRPSVINFDIPIKHDS